MSSKVGSWFGRENTIERMRILDYGLTETCKTALLNWPNDLSSTGTIGAAKGSCETKLRAFPEMPYTPRTNPIPDAGRERLLAISYRYFQPMSWPETALTRGLGYR